MIINGKELLFREEDHSYLVDGKQCISVTQLLKFKYPRKYDAVDQKTLDEASRKGTELHEAIEVYEGYGLARDDLQEFRNYKHLKEMFGFEVVECEQPIILEIDGLTVCGRLDQIQRNKDGQLGIGDIKRTATLDKEYLAYQLNLYRLGYQQSYNQKMEFLRGIHLKDDKRKYVTIPINEGMTYQLIEEYKRSLENDK